MRQLLKEVQIANKYKWRKVAHSLAASKMQICTTTRIVHPTPGRIAIIEKQKNKKPVRTKGKEPLHAAGGRVDEHSHCGNECKAAFPSQKQCPVVPLLGTCPKRAKWVHYRDTCTLGLLNSWVVESTYSSGNVVYTNGGVLLGHKEEHNYVIFRKMDRVGDLMTAKY